MTPRPSTSDIHSRGLIAWPVLGVAFLGLWLSAPVGSVEDDPTPPEVVDQESGAMSGQEVRVGAAWRGAHPSGDAAVNRQAREIERRPEDFMSRRRVRTRSRLDDFSTTRRRTGSLVRNAVGHGIGSTNTETARILWTRSRALLSYGAAHHAARTGVLCAHSTTRPPPART